jgi:uncharacterized membrane protein YphA (DoxX/SURF4 family)
MSTALDRLHARVRASRWLLRFTWFTRILLSLAFLPSGMTKLLGNRFTLLGTDTPIGFFFEALYSTGFYWRFLGLAQLGPALLLLIPRTTTLGAVLYFPVILNVCLITWSLHFQGTTWITSFMLLGSVYLLCWDYDRWKRVLPGPGCGQLDQTSAGPPSALLS